MSLRINTNTTASNAYRNLSITSDAMNSSLTKLSSGYRINKAADDAAGLAISEGLKAQIGGLSQAVTNASDAISVVQTAEGALTETTAILQRMTVLATQAANSGSYNDSAIGNIATEVTGLMSELSDIASKTTFNGKTLLSGAYSGTFQVGAQAADTMSITLASGMSAGSLGLSGTLTSANASLFLATIASALSTVTTARANLGAYQNRLQHKINNLNVTIQNLTSSNSQVVDTDMALEMVEFTRTQILSQAGTSMLSQANQSSQGVLKLLQ